MPVSEVTIEELESALQSGARLVDVREPDEYEAGHVPGALLVPLNTVPHALDQFASGDTTYVICKSGARSYRACEFLVDQGLDASRGHVVAVLLSNLVPVLVPNLGGLGSILQ